MGQSIEIVSTVVIGTTVMFSTDRGITGQEGSSFDVGTVADEESIPGRLAARIFAADDGVDHVFVASNQVVVRRATEWEEPALEAVGAIVERFFVFYGEASV